MKKLKLVQSGLKVHMKKCNFCAPEVEYLCYVITRKGIKPHKDKIEAILKLVSPKTVHYLIKLLLIVGQLFATPSSSQPPPRTFDGRWLW